MKMKAPALCATLPFKGAAQEKHVVSAGWIASQESAVEPDHEPANVAGGWAGLLEAYESGKRNFSSFRAGHPEQDPDWTGVVFEEACFDGAAFQGIFSNVTFVNCNFVSADFRGATLQNVHFENCWLQDASFDGAVFRNETWFRLCALPDARFESAKLTTTQFAGCVGNVNFRHATSTAAVFAQCNFVDSQFGHASLRHARFYKTVVREADFTNVDLRDTKGFAPDATQLRNTQFSPAGWLPARPDDWSAMRQKYTGTKMVFHLMLLFAFLLPLLLRTAFWVSINEVQTRAQNQLGPLQVRAAQMAAELTNLTADARGLIGDLQQPGKPLDLERLRKLIAAIDKTAVPSPLQKQKQRVLGVLRFLGDPNRQPCLAKRCKDRPVISLLLRTAEPFPAWLFAPLLVLYNIGRLLLTWIVGPLRDEEERSGWSPTRDRTFRLTVGMHYVVWALGWAALVAGGWHLYDWLSITVSVAA